MSDIEIIEVPKGVARKKSHKMSKKDNNKNRSKRKRTSSGLINENGEMKGTETEFKHFVIDRTETPQRKCKIKELDDNDICFDAETPSSWLKLMQKSLLGAEPEPQESNAKFRSKKSCYNCGKDHNLSDCPLPRNFKRISEARREAAEEIRQRQAKYNQRLTDQNSDQKGFKPGVLSRNLREALGIGYNDIPEHIYRMRRMGFIKGYPPGYLKKAIKNNFRVLKIISSDTKHVPDKIEEKPPVLDSEKIISYSGFNQYDRSLNDLENFKIPSFDVFCDKYEEELRNMYKRKKEQKKNKTKETKNKHTVFSKESDDEDIIIIDRQSSETAECVTPGEERVVETLNSDVSENMENRTADVNDSVNEGDSLFHLVGTPIFSSRTSDGLWSRTAIPSLEAFSVGIIPFTAQEEMTQNKGIFKRLMSKLRRSPEDAEVVKVKDDDDDIVIIEKDETTEKKKKKKKKSKKRKAEE